MFFKDLSQRHILTTLEAFAPFLRALQISRYPHDHSRFVNRFSRNCTTLTNPVSLTSPACFVVSWFRGFAESVLQHPFYERHLRNLMKRFRLAAVFGNLRKVPQSRRISPHRGSFDKFDLDHLAVELLCQS